MKLYLRNNDNVYFQGSACATTTPTIEIMISVSNLLMVLNATSNFFIYMWKGTQFRRILQQKANLLYTRSTRSTGPFELNEYHRRISNLRSLPNDIPTCDV